MNIRTLIAMTGGDLPKALLTYKALNAGGASGHASGALATFETTKSANLKALKVAIEPVQAGSGDPSPDNVRPISGWTGVNVTRTGKNLFNEVDAEQTVSTDRYAVLENGLLHYKSDGSSWMYTKIVSVYLKTGTYVLSFQNYRLVSGATPIWMVKAYGQTSYPTTSTPYVLSVTEDTTVEIRITTSGTTSASEFYGNIQLEPGSTVTAYEPYQGNTYSVTFPSDPGTVYGGTLDVLSGVLTVDRAMKVIDGVNETVRANGLTDIASKAWFPNATGKAYGRTNFISNIFIADGRSSYPYTMMGRDNSIGIELNLPPDVPQDVPSLNAWFAANPNQIVYELATPLTYNLTPTQIKTLVGTNNIWSDAGDVDVAYRR